MAVHRHRGPIGGALARRAAPHPGVMSRGAAPHPTLVGAGAVVDAAVEGNRRPPGAPDGRSAMTTIRPVTRLRRPEA